MTTNPAPLLGQLTGPPGRGPRKQVWPRLREELRLYPASPQRDGTPAWTIQDPVSNRFYRIGWLDFELLAQWALGDARRIVRQVNADTPLHATVEDVQALIAFLSQHQLLRVDGAPAVDRMAQRVQSQRQGWWARLLHHYLFFRVPLVRPQAWLARAQPLLAALHLRRWAFCIALTSLLGLWLVSRQWETFSHTFLDSLSWSGLLGYGLALLGAKTAHELGHAAMATRHGVRVAHMGVAMVVMFPMLYTDTGESWRLARAGQRLAIASAGIAVELALAGLATLAWALLPDGATRNAMFFLATTSWVMSLAINASPFMRFDGYFILSDALDMPNLHERAGALARVALRRLLLGWQEPWPEALPDRQRLALIGFAWVTWAYRLVVFLGIALVVYHFFFKALGIVLMLVEVHVFLLSPVLRELAAWRASRETVGRGRRLAAVWLALAGCLVLAFPFRARVDGAGWLHAAQQQSVHAPLAARVVALPANRHFHRGDVMFVLEQPGLAIEQGRSVQEALTRERQLAGLIGLPDGGAQRQRLQSQKAMAEAQARLSGDQRQRLALRAPFDGVLRDLDPALAPGVWVKPREPLAWLVDPAQWVIDLYVPEEDLQRIAVDNPVRARRAGEPWGTLQGRVESIDISPTTVLPTPLLAARHGGAVVTVEGERSLVPQDALFRVRVALDGPPALAQEAALQVQIDGQAVSIGGRFLRHTASVLLRETGF